MTGIIRINHIAIAVNDLEEAAVFWRDLLGLPLDHIEHVEEQKTSVAFLPVGESEIELVCPTDPETGLGKFLASKGPGLHHICFEVDDIAAALQELKSKQVQLINQQALELPGRKMAFIHPKSTGGVLVELYEIIAQE